MKRCRAELLLLSFVLLFAACTQKAPPEPRPQTTSGPKLRSANPQSHPVCPPATGSVQQPAGATGDHEVLLTWNPSAPSPEKAVGYCLYRSPQKGDAQHAADTKSPCHACELVNSTPVTGTKCVDDVVRDGAIYFYVAMAISSQQHLSTASNEVKAKIPSGKRKSDSPDLSGYPRCRASGN